MLVGTEIWEVSVKMVLMIGYGVAMIYATRAMLKKRCDLLPVAKFLFI